MSNFEIKSNINEWAELLELGKSSGFSFNDVFIFLGLIERAFPQINNFNERKEKFQAIIELYKQGNPDVVDAFRLVKEGPNYIEWNEKQ